MGENNWVWGQLTEDDMGTLYMAADAYLTNNREVLTPEECDRLDTVCCKLSAVLNGVHNADGTDAE